MSTLPEYTPQNTDNLSIRSYFWDAATHQTFRAAQVLSCINDACRASAKVLCILGERRGTAHCPLHSTAEVGFISLPRCFLVTCPWQLVYHPKRSQNKLVHCAQPSSTPPPSHFALGFSYHPTKNSLFLLLSPTHLISSPYWQISCSIVTSRVHNLTVITVGLRLFSPDLTVSRCAGQLFRTP
jgi:hypothetical protein